MHLLQLVGLLVTDTPKAMEWRARDSNTSRKPREKRGFRIKAAQFPAHMIRQARTRPRIYWRGTQSWAYDQQGAGESAGSSLLGLGTRPDRNAAEIPHAATTARCCWPPLSDEGGTQRSLLRDTPDEATTRMDAADARGPVLEVCSGLVLQLWTRHGHDLGINSSA